MKKLILVCAFFLISACATTGKYIEKVKSFQGQKERAVLAYWGAPDDTYISDDGFKYLTYRRNVGHITAPMTTNMTYSKNQWCKTSFIINKQGIVQGYQIDGNECTSY